MKRPLMIALLCAAAAGCEGAPRELTLDTGEKTGLKGMVIRDHPDGAEVVSSPNPNYQPGTVMVSVDNSPVRGAAHFRDMVSAAERRDGGYMLTAAPTAEALEAWKQQQKGR